MTRRHTLALAAAFAAAGLLAAAPADAGGRRGHHRSHIHFGLSFGVPLAAGIAWHYAHPHYVHYATPYYAPRVIVVPPPAPVTYIEQPAPQAQAPAQNWWYWCASANAYYPYVNECAGGWQRVAPQPPAPQ